MMLGTVSYDTLTVCSARLNRLSNYENENLCPIAVGRQQRAGRNLRLLDCLKMAESLSPELLRQVGEALYGEQWQTELARALDVNNRTVRRWVAGTWEPRPQHTGKLYRLVCQRRDALQAIVPALADLLRD